MENGSIIFDMECLRNGLAALVREVACTPYTDTVVELQRDAQSILNRLYQVDQQLATTTYKLSSER